MNRFRDVARVAASSFARSALRDACSVDQPILESGKNGSNPMHLSPFKAVKK